MFDCCMQCSNFKCSIMFDCLSVGFPNIRLCSIGKSFGCVGLSLITEPNKKSIERLRLASITQRLIDYAGDITHQQESALNILSSWKHGQSDNILNNYTTRLMWGTILEEEEKIILRQISSVKSRASNFTVY